MKIAEDGGAEDTGEDEHAERRKIEILADGGEWAVEENVAWADEAEIIERDAHKAQTEENCEIDVSGDAFGTELEFEEEEREEKAHGSGLLRSLLLMFDASEVNVFEVDVGGREA